MRKPTEAEIKRAENYLRKGFIFMSTSRANEFIRKLAREFAVVADEARAEEYAKNRMRWRDDD